MDLPLVNRRRQSFKVPLLILSLALCCLPAFVRAEDRAVVVGVGDYAALDDTPPLDGAVADALRFRAFLLQSGGFAAEQVTLLLNEEATSDAIVSAIIDELIAQTRTGDQAIFYFAGLGTRVNSSEGVGPALLTHDTGLGLSRIRSDLIADILDTIPDRQVTVVIDAGFQGGSNLPMGIASRGWSLGEVPSASADEPLFGQGQVTRTVWNAAKPGQPAVELAGAGVFTSRFLAALNAGLATNGEILANMQEQAFDRCATNPICDPSFDELSPALAGELGAKGILLAQPVGKDVSIEPVLATYADLRGFARSALAGSNAAGLQVSLAPEEPRIGDVVTMTATSDRPGVLLLIDIHESGPAGLLGATLRLKAGSPERLRFRASEPTGSGFLLAAIVEGDALPIGALLPEGEAAEADPGSLLVGLSGRVSTFLAGAEGTAAFDWSAVVLDYSVKP